MSKPAASKKSRSPRKPLPQAGAKRVARKAGSPAKHVAVVAKRDKVSRRGEKLNRVLNKVLKAYPDALRAIAAPNVQADIARILGSRCAASTPGDRLRTTYVMFTSDMFSKVHREHPELKPNEIFKKLARVWRDKIARDPEQMAIYTKMTAEFNDRVNRKRASPSRS